jgi:hypothetical protein
MYVPLDKQVTMQLGLPLASACWGRGASSASTSTSRAASRRARDRLAAAPRRGSPRAERVYIAPATRLALVPSCRCERRGSRWARRFDLQREDVAASPRGGTARPFLASATLRAQCPGWLARVLIYAAGAAEISSAMPPLAPRLAGCARRGVGSCHMPRAMGESLSRHIYCTWCTCAEIVITS